jgi:hypothetical protein
LTVCHVRDVPSTAAQSELPQTTADPAEMGRVSVGRPPVTLALLVTPKPAVVAPQGRDE